MRTRIFYPFALVLVAIAFIVPQTFAQSVTVTVPSEYEAPPTLDAEVILRPEFQRGAHFKVRGEVPTYAGANEFTIDSDYGVFTATGNTQLVERVQEIEAIAKLREVSRTDEYKQALKTAATSPVKLARNLVTQPVKTISGVPKGIYKFLNRAGQSIKEMGEQRPRSPYEDDAGKDLIGFSDAKRKLALRLEVDPYSTNEVFQRELNGISWAAFAGSMTVNVALLPVGGTAGTTITAVSLTNSNLEILRDNDPTDLRRLNLGKLLEVGVPREDAVAFLNDMAYSPTDQTLFVAALTLLEGVRGRAEFVRLATEATDQTDAIFFRRTAQLMAKVQHETPLASIRLLQDLPVCVARDGTVVVALEWDYVAHTNSAATFLQALKEMNTDDGKITGYSLVISGVASPMVKEHLATHGVRLTERALPGPLQ